MENEITEQVKDQLEQRRTELVKIIESFENLEKSKEWLILKELIFDKALIAVDRQILNESLMQEIDINKLYKLQGERIRARRYSDMGEFIETFKKQLEEINKKIK